MLKQREWGSALALVAAVAAGAALASGCGGGEADGVEDAASLDEAQQALGGVADRLDRFVPHEAIVTFRAPPDWSAIRSLAGHRIAPVIAIDERTYLVRLSELAARAAGEAATAAAVSALAAAGDTVESAIPNWLLSYSLAPSDPLYPHQSWNYSAVRAPQAWDITTGGSGVRVAVLDSGKAFHPDLSWGVGFDAVENDADPTNPDTYHHGVHVAGIVGARAYNGRGGVGVCWNCTVVPVRVSNASGPQLAAIAAGIRWVAGYNGSNPVPGPRRAEVINMSFESDAACSNPGLIAIRNAIDDAVGRAGISMVAAAGNQSASASAFPGNCAGVISVAASQPGGSLAPYSNRGSNVDITAPGGGYNNSTAWRHFGASVGAPPCPQTGAANPNGDPYQGTNGVVSSWSTWMSAWLHTPADHCYRHISGTSMAAPHVAGVIGLMRSVDPNLTPARVEQYIVETANPTGVSCPIAGQCGSGMIDAERAVKAARDGLPDIDVSPASLAFPITPIFTESTLPLSVRNVLTGPLTATLTLGSPKLTLSCASGTCACTASTCNLTVLSGQQAVVNVRYAPTNTVALSSYVRIASNDPNESVVQVPVTAATFGHARTSPEIVHFGFENVGSTSAPQSAYLHNIGTGPLVISSLSLTGQTSQFIVNPAFAMPYIVPPGGAVEVAVRCAPTSVDRKDMWIAFNTNATYQGEPILARCYATAPDGHLSIAAPGPGFGDQPYGVLTTSTVRVSNHSAGSNMLTFSLSRPSAPFSLSCVSGCTCSGNVCSGVVPAGHSDAVLSLGFLPMDVDKHISTITFTSNTPGRPPEVITVLGAGVLVSDPEPLPLPQVPPVEQ